MAEQPKPQPVPTPPPPAPTGPIQPGASAPNEQPPSVVGTSQAKKEK